ncbi:hypothetical protein [Helicobacter sp. 11S03491-1]|uniref:putative barnase/colicin E5 family endoribonuclease n=1 Tax=Helicobacter sp. 11S03491-1 TaxID=1476196 RepID=UPI000BA578B3|nr:hypothetical protein [Helicobacter sp. 11S03491-1]PAF41803.1 hypothetical protein BKH45_05685 [Helicobacter sp. 11S03491-1]
MQDKTQAYIVAAAVSKHINESSAGGKYVDWLGLRESLKSLEEKIENPSLKDYIATLKGMSELFYNDGNIIKQIQGGNIPLPLGANGLSTNLIVKAHTGLVNGTFKKLQAFLPNTSGRNAAFLYHIKKAMNQSRTSKDFFFNLISDPGTPASLIAELKNEILSISGTLGKVMTKATQALDQNAQQDYVELLKNAQKYQEKQSLTQEAKENPKPNHEPLKEFGTNYPEYYHDGKGAITKLLQTKEGQVMGAFYKEGLGDIDLVWGDEKMGLSHILSKHPEVVDKIPEIINDGAVVVRKHDATQINKDGYKVVLKSNLYGEPTDNHWVITAYEDTRGRDKFIDSIPNNSEETLSKTSSSNPSTNEIKNQATLSTQEAKENPKPNQEPLKEFGTNYPEYYHDGKGAITKLLQTKEGQVMGAFYKEGLGDIDLVWGDEKMGLSHILSKHPEVVDKIPEIIQNGEAVENAGVKSIKFNNGKSYRIGLSKGWNNKGDNHWVITAYEDTKSPHPDVRPSNEVASQSGTDLSANDLSENPSTNEVKNQARAKENPALQAWIKDYQKLKDKYKDYFSAQRLKGYMEDGISLQSRAKELKDALEKAESEGSEAMIRKDLAVIQDKEVQDFFKKADFDKLKLLSAMDDLEFYQAVGNNQKIIELIEEKIAYLQNKIQRNQEAKPNHEPLKEFGTNYPEYYHDGKGAITKLLQTKEGQVMGAFYKEGLGDIDLVWGDKRGGLSHILDKHGKDTALKIDDVIETGQIFRDKHNRLGILKDNQIVGIHEKYKGDDRQWIVTSYELKDPKQYLDGAEAYVSEQLGKTNLSKNLSPDNPSTNEVKNQARAKENPALQAWIKDYQKLKDKYKDYFSPQRLKGYMEDGISLQSRAKKLKDILEKAEYEVNEAMIKKDLAVIQDKEVQDFFKKADFDKLKLLSAMDDLEFYKKMGEHQKIKELGDLLEEEIAYLQNKIQRDQEANLTKAQLQESPKIKEDYSNKEPLSTQEPLKEFGTNYPEYYHDGKGAITKLLQTKEGQVMGAFYKEGLGDIDLVWGEVSNPSKHTGYGLAHILDKHPDFDIGLIPEIVEKGNIINRHNGYNIESEKYIVGINKGFDGKGDNHWIVSAFDSKKPTKSASSDVFKESESLPSNLPHNPTTSELKSQEELLSKYPTLISTPEQYDELMKTLNGFALYKSAFPNKDFEIQDVLSAAADIYTGLPDRDIITNPQLQELLSHLDDKHSLVLRYRHNLNEFPALIESKKFELKMTQEAAQAIQKNIEKEKQNDRYHISYRTSDLQSKKERIQKLQRDISFLREELQKTIELSKTLGHPSKEPPKMKAYKQIASKYPEGLLLFLKYPFDIQKNAENQTEDIWKSFIEEIHQEIRKKSKTKKGERPPRYNYEDLERAVKSQEVRDFIEHSPKEVWDYLNLKDEIKNLQSALHKNQERINYAKANQDNPFYKESLPMFENSKKNIMQNLQDTQTALQALQIKSNLPPKPKEEPNPNAKIKEDYSNKEPLSTQEAKENLKPNQEPLKEFGTNYPEYYHDGKGAITKLLQTKEGQVMGAFYKEGLGDIDLVWGDEKMGLSHILSKHPEVVDKIPEIINDGKVDRGTNRIFLNTDDSRIAIALDYKGKDKKWIITAYNKDYLSPAYPHQEQLTPATSAHRMRDNLQPNPSTNEVKNQAKQTQKEPNPNAKIKEDYSNKEPLSIQEPLKEFGTNYPEYYHDGKGAIEKLLQTKEGQVMGAFYHPDIGDITLVWGKEGSAKSDGFGLAKIVKFHPEVVDKLDGIINNGRFILDEKQRPNIVSDNSIVGLRNDWKGEKTPYWVISSYSKKDSTKGIDSNGHSVKESYSLNNPSSNPTTSELKSQADFFKKYKKFTTKNNLESLYALGNIKHSRDEVLQRDAWDDKVLKDIGEYSNFGDKKMAALAGNPKVRALLDDPVGREFINDMGTILDKQQEIKNYLPHIQKLEKTYRDYSFAKKKNAYLITQSEEELNRAKKDLFVSVKEFQELSALMGQKYPAYFDENPNVLNSALVEKAKNQSLPIDPKESLSPPITEKTIKQKDIKDILSIPAKELQEVQKKASELWEKYGIDIHNIYKTLQEKEFDYERLSKFKSDFATGYPKYIRRLQNAIKHDKEKYQKHLIRYKDELKRSTDNTVSNQTKDYKAILQNSIKTNMRKLKILQDHDVKEFFKKIHDQPLVYDYIDKLRIIPYFLETQRTELKKLQKRKGNYFDFGTIKMIRNQIASLKNEFEENIDLRNKINAFISHEQKQSKLQENPKIKEDYSNKEPLSTQEAKENPKPNHEPLKEFGTNYPEYYHDGKGAITKLLQTKEGQVMGAFYKEGLGDIDLVWGEVSNPSKHTGYGLAHILDKHPDFDIGLIPEIVEKGKVVENAGVKSIKFNNGKSYRIGLSKGWLDKGDNHWVITAYEDTRLPHSDSRPSNEVASQNGTDLSANNLQPNPSTNEVKNQERQTQKIDLELSLL